MSQRLDYASVSQAALKAAYQLELFVSRDAGLSPRILHLMKLRASQVNGCAHCVDMYVKEAQKAGLSEQWIALVAVWKEALVFDERERAVLGWTEALTRFQNAGRPMLPMTRWTITFRKKKLST